MRRSSLPVLLVLLFTAVAASAQESGEALLQKCRICHTFDAGGRNVVGPNLHGVFGRKAGIASNYQFSIGMTNSGIVWDEDTLAKFLRDPKGFMPGNRMAFPGITDDVSLNDLIGRLKQATQ